jgi:GT2 family glycosyltransferase
MQGRISASIVVYKNDPTILSEAVKSFLESTSGSKLYIVDNSPTDEIASMVDHPRVEYIFNNRNVGFGAGHNIALRKMLREGRSDYHIVLNPDIYFEKNVVTKLTDYMESNTQVGLIMPKVLYPDGRLQPVCKLLPSPATLISRRFLKFNSSLTKRINHWYEMHFTGYDKIMDVPFLSGCFMYLRVDALKKIGLFDERIFLYTEDTDLSRRIHQYYRTVFYPDAVIYHYNERASYSSAFALVHHTRSAITYFNKWGWFNDAEREIINQQVLLKLTR